MRKVIVLGAVLVQLALTGCGHNNNNVAMPPQACGAGVPAQYCVSAQNLNNGYGNSPTSAPQGFGPYVACSPQDPNACASTGGFCQPFTSAPSMGYCVAN